MKPKPPNPNEAFRLLLKAAELGDANSQAKVWRHFAPGSADSQDYEDSIHFIRKSADQGVDEALLHLGICYLNGLGVTRDMDLAAKYLKGRTGVFLYDAGDGIRSFDPNIHIPATNP